MRSTSTFISSCVPTSISWYSFYRPHIVRPAVGDQRTPTLWCTYTPNFLLLQKLPLVFVSQRLSSFLANECVSEVAKTQVFALTFTRPRTSCAVVTEGLSPWCTYTPSCQVRSFLCTAVKQAISTWALPRRDCMSEFVHYCKIVAAVSFTVSMCMQP